MGVTLGYMLLQGLEGAHFVSVHALWSCVGLLDPSSPADSSASG